MRTVRVELDDRSYDIRIGDRLVDDLGRQCARLGLGRRCAVISDTKVAPLYAEAAIQSLKAAGFEAITCNIFAGEQSKNLRSVNTCYTTLAKHRLERKSFVVALGGGVVGDMAGFVAATYLRGVPFVQVPTTLLSQVDSSVGGKVGVNLRAGKNLVGAFYQPQVVLCDLATLDSLPEREFRAGLAEIIKYGIIYDARFFNWLERDLDKLLARDRKALTRAIARSCEIKAAVVGEDEKEGGLRAILNYGHTIGHAIEAITAYGTYLHGEAISIGQILASELSAGLLGMPARDVVRVRHIFQRAGLPTRIDLSRAQTSRLFAAMSLDKKVSDGRVKFVLADKIGSVRFGQSVSDVAIRAALENQS
ncbi:MAG: 3-dehydroquinate synthase [Verrucomicrobiae bacterium]|nr:3-dehydroquinate synthase [Verrucomicrobiae bacterium]